MAARLSIDAEHILNLCGDELSFETRHPVNGHWHVIIIAPFADNNASFSVTPSTRAVSRVDLTDAARLGAFGVALECTHVPLLCYNASLTSLSARLETYLITHAPSLVIVANEVAARAIAPLLRERGHARCRVAWPHYTREFVAAGLSVLALE